MADETHEEKQELGDWTGRFFVYFQQYNFEAPVDAEGVRRPANVTFGPYSEVEISDGKMWVDGGDDYEEGDNPCGFILAEAHGDSWEVHDGLGNAGVTYGFVRFLTMRPRPSGSSEARPQEKGK